MAHSNDRPMRGSGVVIELFGRHIRSARPFGGRRRRRTMSIAAGRSSAVSHAVQPVSDAIWIHPTICGPAEEPLLVRDGAYSLRG